MRLAQDTDARIPGGETLCHFHCRVTRAIVDDQRFPVGETLLEETVKCLPERGCGVEHRNDHRDAGRRVTHGQIPAGVRRARR